jgi:hypothetical protein
MKNASHITNTLNEMTRPDLAAVATSLGVPVGKSKANTVSNLAKAIQAGKARFTIQFTIRKNADPKANYAPAVFSMKLRTHKDDKIVVAAPQSTKQ